MECISARRSIFGEYAIIALLLVFPLALSLSAVIDKLSWTDVLMPFGLGVIAFILVRNSFSELADEVIDDGDALLVRYGRRQERIPLYQISDAKYSRSTKLSGGSASAKVTLSLRSPSLFGETIKFMVRPPVPQWGTSPVVKSLFDRIGVRTD